MKNSQKISKNTSRCDESNGVKFSQKISFIQYSLWEFKVKSKKKKKKMGRPMKAHRSNRSNRPVNRSNRSIGPNSKFKFEFKKIKNSQKISKNTSKCDESNGVKFLKNSFIQYSLRGFEVKQKNVHTKIYKYNVKVVQKRVGGFIQIKICYTNIYLVYFAGI